MPLEGHCVPGTLQDVYLGRYLSIYTWYQFRSLSECGWTMTPLGRSILVPFH